MHKITPFLWFDNQAEEAANYYVSIFGNSRILQIARYGEAGPGPRDTVADGVVRNQRTTIHRAERRSAVPGSRKRFRSS